MDRPPPRPRGPPPKPAGSPPRQPLDVPAPTANIIAGPRSPPPRGPAGAVSPPPGKPPPRLPPPKKIEAAPAGAKAGMPPFSPPEGSPPGPGIAEPKIPPPGVGPPRGLPPRQGPPVPGGAPPRQGPPVPGGSPPRPGPPVPGGVAPRPGPPVPGGSPPRPGPPGPGGVAPRPGPPVPGGSPPRPGPPVPGGSPPRPGPPVPGGSPPRPGPPVPGGRPPIPGGRPPMPSGRPPVPGGSPPIPGGRPPIPAGRPPVPGGRPPIPGGSPPRPAGSPPAPAGRPPVPAGRPPVPGGRPPAPAGRPPAPAGRPPAPAGRPPAPAGRPPAPAGRPPPPDGRPPAPSSPPPPDGVQSPTSGEGRMRPPPPSAAPPEARKSGIGRPPPPRSPPPPDGAIQVSPPTSPIPSAPMIRPEMDDIPPPPEPQDDVIADEDRPPEVEENIFREEPMPLPKLVPGRFIIEVVEGRALKKHDASAAITATKIDPYIKASLGVHKSAPSFKGRVHKNQGKNVQFEERFTLDMVHPEEFVAENDIKLCISVMNSNMLSDTVLGQVEISMLPLLVNFSRDRSYPLYFRKKKSDVKDRAGEIELRIRFRPAKAGCLVVTCREGRKMKNMELMGKQDPYCKFEFGKDKPKRTKTIKNGGTDCSFNDERVMILVGTEAWTDPLIFSCFDEDFGSDDLIGAHVFDILDFVSDATNIEDLQAEGLGRVHEEWYEIFQGKDRDKLSGEILLRFEFLPAGQLTLTTIEGRHLVDKDTLGKQDPFIVYQVQSEKDVSNIRIRTKTDKDGGTNPRWDETHVLQIVDQHEITMEVFDEDTFGSNDLIGKASFSLLPVFRKGVIDTWVTLKNKDSWGRVTKCGEIHLHIDFQGPPKVGYPLLQPQMDTFDDSERVNRVVAEQVVEEKKENDQPPQLSNEFTDEEIEQSFQAIDLNKNGFIGAAELKHMLICMGELITDEEIDEMIRMVDGDGDGQVSFDEYAALLLHPDPSSSSFDPVKVLEAKGGNVILGLDAKELAAKREADASTKQEKMTLMRIFAKENEVNLQFLQRCFDKFRLLDRAQGGSFAPVDFSSMCDILMVEPVGEYKKMFKILDYNNEGRVDMRELLLGLSNFANATLEGRCNFCFTMFDADGNGTLDRDELTDIVKAIHLASDKSTVTKKVDTIMRQCDQDGSNNLDREEFVFVARKFPNLLLNANMD